METELFKSLDMSMANFSHVQMIINMILALCYGLLTAVVYRYTHTGLSYSQSFTLTLVFVATIVSIIMMIIGSSLARAFALVGALSIIRFRTVIKDTKDIAFVFAALALGMAAGTGNYFLGMSGAVFFSITAIVLHKVNFGLTIKSEFLLRFIFETKHDSKHYIEVIKDIAKRWNLLHMEPSGDDKFLTLTYDISLKKGIDTKDFVSKLNRVAGVSEVTLIASKNDAIY